MKPIGLLRSLLVAVGLVLLSGGALAHKAGDSYLTLQADGPQLALRWDVALRDLDRELALDADDDGRLSWREVRTRWGDIERYAAAGLQLQADGLACAPDAARTVSPPQLERHSDGSYAALSLAYTCASSTPRQLSVDYKLFAASDATHRGILRLSAQEQAQTAVLVPAGGTRLFELQAPTTPLHTLAEFIGQGVWHIAIGADHILFLLSLLVVAVLVREPQAWAPAPALKPTMWDVLRVVTAFTMAHSITLALAVLDVWNPPSRWVESLIAVSVLLAALNNLRPVVHRGRWMLTFAFGLVHGFGFAGALKDLGLGGGSLAWPLLGFNLGVELGQLLIVAVFMPLAWALRATGFYRRGVVMGGSVAIAVLATLWLTERVFELELLLGFI